MIQLFNNHRNPIIDSIVFELHMIVENSSQFEINFLS